MAQDNILRSDIMSHHDGFDTAGAYLWNELNKLDNDAVCLIEANSGIELTIGELRRQANSIAVALIEREITKTDRIAFYGRNSIQHSVLRFVAYFLGITFMPLSPTFEKYEVEQEVNSAGANIIFSSAQELHKFDNILNDNKNNNKSNVKLVVVFDGKDDKYLTFEQLLEEGRDQTLDRIPHFEVNPETDMFFLMHTSGSTGRPKCAMLPHRTFLHSLEDPGAKLNRNYGNVIGFVYPFGHITGTIMLSLQIISGAKIILFADFNEELLYKSIDKYRITALPAFPSIALTLADSVLAQKYDLSSLKILTCTGGPTSASVVNRLIERYGIVFSEAYGMTETYFVTQGAEVGEGYIPGNQGRLLPGLELKIVDFNTGQTLGQNSEGEVMVRGVKLFAGYLNDVKATKEAIDEDGWYNTGDFGQYDEKGRLFLSGRLKEVVRIGVDNHYVNISPVEIELFLISHKSIAEVAVIGVNNKSGTHWPRAYVVLKEGHTVTEQDIQKFVSDTLAYTKHLKGGVVFVDRIHTIGIGKIDRKYYRNLVKDEIID